MATTHSVYIEAPVDKVFNFWKDPRNQFSLAPDDRAALTDVKPTEDVVGTYYSVTTKLAGATLEAFFVITEVIPNRRIVDKSSMALHGTVTHLFEPEGSGTRMTVQWQPRSVWRLRPFESLAARFMAARHDQVFRKLKETLEATSTPAEVAG
jgi:uncharacterized protein YndB with AHSA1/START domain